MVISLSLHILVSYFIFSRTLNLNFTFKRFYLINKSKINARLLFITFLNEKLNKIKIFALFFAFYFNAL